MKKMTKYEVFERIWLGSIILFVSLLIILMMGRVGHNDLRHALNDETYVNNSFMGISWEE